jgi:hypothetical protein
VESALTTLKRNRLIVGGRLKGTTAWIEVLSVHARVYRLASSDV